LKLSQHNFITKSHPQQDTIDTGDKNNFHSCFTSKMTDMLRQVVAREPGTDSVDERAPQMGFYYPMVNLTVKVITYNGCVPCLHGKSQGRLVR
jgi:hypothetical protein